MPFEQLALNLTETEAPTLENFDADGNREAVAALAACRAGTGRSLSASGAGPAAAARICCAL